jgi:hypothetical protein
MTMNTGTQTFVLDIDRDLIEHRAHLPETTECICGYRRHTNIYFATGILHIVETGFELPAMNVTCGFRPDRDWFGSEAGGFCGETAPWPAYLSQCIGKPGHGGAHCSFGNDWASPDTLAA